MITTNALPATSRKGRLITLWILSSLVALAFIAAGGSKLAGVPAMVELFDKVGLGQWFRYFTGLREVAAGIGLLISRYAFYAALLLAVVVVAAFITHLTVLGSSPAATVALFVFTGIIAYFTKALNINQERTRI
jgi:putative oxidoreductase